jgi:RNA ligase
MTTMTDLFGSRAAHLVVEQAELGNITLREHEDDRDYLIANYTPKAAYEGAWNPVTRAARGLIFHSVSEQVLARPFAKFFNYGQDGAPPIGYTQEVMASNKYDGSLGIAYIAPDGLPAIATRGSFHSTQARHATHLLRSDSILAEAVELDLERGYTPLFEIIYPENRIVLDYGKLDYLQYLGVMNNVSGAFFPNEEEPIEFGELLRRAPRPNAEGYVVWLDQYTAVKIKQADYVALHKIVTNLNEKTVWEQVQKGPDEFRKFVADLPDELQPWADGVAFDLALQYGEIAREVDEWYLHATDTAWARTEAGEPVSRKEFALAVQDEVPAFYRGLVFASNDGKDYQDKIWKLIEPNGPGSRPSSALATEEEA